MPPGDSIFDKRVSRAEVEQIVFVDARRNDQKRRFLDPMARGDMLACFCLTEPQAGSDAAAIKTSAKRHGNRWVLNGACRQARLWRDAGFTDYVAKFQRDALIASLQQCLAEPIAAA